MLKPKNFLLLTYCITYINIQIVLQQKSLFSSNVIYEYDILAESTRFHGYKQFLKGKILAFIKKNRAGSTWLFAGSSGSSFAWDYQKCRWKNIFWKFFFWGVLIRDSNSAEGYYSLIGLDQEDFGPTRSGGPKSS